MPAAANQSGCRALLVSSREHALQTFLFDVVVEFANEKEHQTFVGRISVSSRCGGGIRSHSHETKWQPQSSSETGFQQRVGAAGNEGRLSRRVDAGTRRITTHLFRKDTIAERPCAFGSSFRRACRERIRARSITLVTEPGAVATGSYTQLGNSHRLATARGSVPTSNRMH